MERRQASSRLSGGNEDEDEKSGGDNEDKLGLVE